MFTRMMRLGTAQVLLGLGMGLGGGLLALQTGCMSNANDYQNPAPTVTQFTTGTLASGTFTPTPAGSTLSIARGGSAWFRAYFAVTGGHAVLMPGASTVTSNVPFQVSNISATTTYLLTVYGGNGQQTSIPVTVVVLPPPTSLRFGAETATYYKDVPIATNAATVAGGGTYTYTVSPSLPTGLNLSAASGAITGTPQVVSAAATYTVTARDAVGQSTTCALQLAVADTPLTLTLSPTSIAPGGASILGWNASSVTGVFSQVIITASPADATLPTTFSLSGTANVSPTLTTTYTLSATPVSGGAEVRRSLGLTVGSAPVSLTALGASPALTTYGGTSDLTWSFTGAPLTLTLDGASVLGLPGTTVHPARRQTFVLTGSNVLNSTPSSLSTTVAARGLDTWLGSPAAGGWLDGTGVAARVLLNTAAISGTTAGSMNLSLDAEGNLYLADALNHVVRKVTPAGVITTLAGKPGVSFVNAATDGTGSGNGSAARFNRPAQVIAIDANTLYAIEYGAHSLRLLTKQGDGTWTVSLAAGTPGTYGNASTQLLDNPLSIAAYSGKIYIADCYTSTIRVFDPLASGNKVSTFAGGGGASSYGLLDGTGTAAKFRTLSSLAIDPATGDIYVADRENHAIRKVTQAGVVTTLAGAYPTAAAGNVDGSGTTARFSRPTGIARAADGTLFVTDNNNHTVRRLAYNAGTAAWDVTTIAGSGTVGNVDGTGTGIQFFGPEGLALDAAGVLYVADAGNSTIRKLTPSGSPAVYASSPFVGLRQNGLVNATGAQARFSVPNGVVYDKNDVAYVADEGNKVIRKVARDGSVTTWGSGVTLTAPYSVTVDDALNVYVLDRLAAGIAVVKINSAGAMSTVTLTGVTFTNSNPRGLAVTGDGTSLFLADGNNLRKFNLATGAQSATITTGLLGVNGIVTAADGVYWVEFTSHTVKKAGLDLSAPVVVAGIASSKGFVDGAGASVARFNQPVALALAKDASGNATKIYVVDQGNHALRVIDRTAGDTVSTLAGKLDTTLATGLPGVFAVLPGTLSATGTAGLYFPKGIAINSLGDLLVTTSDGIVQVTAP